METLELKSDKGVHSTSKRINRRHSWKHKAEYDKSNMFFKRLGKQIPISNNYPNNNELRQKPISKAMSHVVSTPPYGSSIKKDLGHDLDQLTKTNQHEVNLSPHPSLTIMVQPNKIDYAERCK